METYRYQIASRAKFLPVAVAQPDDFELGAQELFDPAHLITSPDWSIYAIDPATDRVAFVEMPQGFDLITPPFVYGAQFEHARSVVIAPLETFMRLSKTGQPSRSLTMLYSTGRCGSTLASRILSKTPDVWSISEPDCLTNLAMARHSTADVLLRDLLVAARQFLCGLAPNGASVVIKPRSEMVFLIEAFSRANPDVSNIFMYRDALGYVGSMSRLVQRIAGDLDFFESPDIPQLGWQFASAQAPDAQAAPFLKHGQTAFDNLETLALAWTLRIRAIEAAAEAGLDIEPIHYADLTSDKRRYTTRLLSACGVGPENVALGLKGFETDAHQGSATANHVPAQGLDDHQLDQVSAMLDRWQQETYLTERLNLRRA